MKIGIISNLYPPYMRGGAEHVVVRTVEGLVEKGHDVFVVSSMRSKRGKDIVVNNNSTERIYQFSPKNLYFVLDDHKFPWIIRLFWHIIDAFSGRGASRLGVILSEEEPDVVMTHNLKGIGLRMGKLIEKRGIPRIHVVHDLQLLIPSGLKFAGSENFSFFTRAFYKVYQSIVKFFIGKPDIVIFPSKYLKDEYTAAGFFKDSKVVVLPNPAPRFEVKSHQNRVAGPLSLLFVGQLEEHKGINFLLDYVSNQKNQDQLIIAGEGSLTADIQEAADNDKRITYLGYIAIDQLLNCFEVVDALIVPSLCYENSPTVIYESLQGGVPVLAADIGGVGELVENGKNGYLFKPGDAEDLEQAVQKLRESRQFFTQSREQIRGTVQPYSMESYLGKIEAFFKEIIDGK